MLVLLAGIVTMHAAVFAISPAPADHYAAMAMPVGPDTAAHATQHIEPSSIVTGSDCAGDGCASGHGAMHACVFILAAAAFTLMLVVLGRCTADYPAGVTPTLRRIRPKRERSPPWTVPSLAELSILRI